MTIQELFVRANQELVTIIEHISDNQWEIDLPAGLTSKPSTLKQAVNYHTYDDAWVPDILVGKSKEEVGDVYEHLLTNGDVKASYIKYNARAIEAVKPFYELDKITHLSYGDFPARDYLQHITIYRSLRVYDMARLIGADTKLAPDFVQALWDEYAPLAEGYRQYGIFPPQIEVSEDADLQTKFLGLVGRE